MEGSLSCLLFFFFLPSDFNPIDFCALEDRFETHQALFYRAVDIFPAEGLGRRREYRNFLGARGDRGIHPFQIGHQSWERNASTHEMWLPLEASHDLSRVCHLRHPFGRDEGSRFNSSQAGLDEPIDELELHARVHDCGFILQTVARPDFTQPHFLSPLFRFREKARQGSGSGFRGRRHA